MVCGASRGIGEAIAEELASEGARVAVVARSEDRLNAWAARTGGLAVAADLSTPEGPAQAVEECAKGLGGLDLLVINGGGPPSGSFMNLDEKSWQLAVEMTLLSTVRLLNAAVPLLQAGDDPAMLTILSSSVREPLEGLDTSNALRPGLAALVKSLAVQLAPIRVNGLLPGKISTDRVASLDAERAARRGVDTETIMRETVGRIPLGRYGTPAEVGRLAAFLCSPAASYVTGVNMAIDGGMMRSLP
jgi:3-oxoacyl-[acyl-carrier protein] reductase